MAFTTDESLSSPSSKTTKPYFLTLISLRVLAIVTTLAAATLVLSSKENKIVYGIAMDARYSYSPAFKFFAFANIVAFVMSIASLVLTFIMVKKIVNPTYYFFLFLHDLIITVLLMAGLASAMSIGYVGKYGNSHTGWMPICDHFGKFCSKTMASLIMGFFSFAVNLTLTVISSKNSTHVQA